MIPTMQIQILIIIGRINPIIGVICVFPPVFRLGALCSLSIKLLEEFTKIVLLIIN